MGQTSGPCRKGPGCSVLRDLFLCPDGAPLRASQSLYFRCAGLSLTASPSSPDLRCFLFWVSVRAQFQKHFLPFCVPCQGDPDPGQFFQPSPQPPWLLSLSTGQRWSTIEPTIPSHPQWIIFNSWEAWLTSCLHQSTAQ